MSLCRLSALHTSAASTPSRACRKGSRNAITLPPVSDPQRYPYITAVPFQLPTDPSIYLLTFLTLSTAHTRPVQQGLSLPPTSIKASVTTQGPLPSADRAWTLSPTTAGRSDSFGCWNQTVHGDASSERSSERTTTVPKEHSRLPTRWGTPLARAGQLCVTMTHPGPTVIQRKPAPN